MGRGTERPQRNCLPHPSDEGYPTTRPVHGASAPTQKRGAAGTCRGEHEVRCAITSAGNEPPAEAGARNLYCCIVGKRDTRGLGGSSQSWAAGFCVDLVLIGGGLVLVRGRRWWCTGGTNWWCWCAASWSASVGLGLVYYDWWWWWPRGRRWWCTGWNWTAAVAAVVGGGMLVGRILLINTCCSKL